MKKNMRLSVRIGLAFGLLLIVILVMGVIGVLSMKRVGRLSNSLATENVPEISLANEIELHALSMVPSLHDYGYTDDEVFLTEVRSQLGQVKKSLADAKAQGTKSARLTGLKDAAVQGEKTVADFEVLTEQRTKLTKELDNEQLNCFAAGTNFTSVCSVFQASQTEAMLGKISAGIDGDQLETNLRRIAYLSSIVQSGDLLLASTWKAQARRDPQLLAESLRLLDVIDSQLNSLEKIIDFENDLKRIKECRASSQNYRESVKRFQEKWAERENLAQQHTALAGSLVEQAGKVASLGLDDTANASKQTAGVAAFSSNLAVIGGILGMVFGIVIATIITGGLNKILRQLTLALNDGSSQVASAADQVSASSQSLAEGSSEQAASLEETSASLEEMASMTKRNAENAQKANDLAKQARAVADKGTSDMQTMNAAMEAIKVSSDDIAKIIKTIDEIAFQTNILALNAAVEAARAGEAGMGFAVVADEVRNLAQRSASAAKETAGKIEGAITKTAQGVGISKQVAETLIEIATKARQVDELVAEVAGASREQTQGITQINTAVGQMDKVTQSNAANAEESAAAAEELNAQATTMKESVAELMRLVGGNGQASEVRTVTASSRYQEARMAEPKARRSAPAQGNGHAPAEPVLSGKSNGRSEIPLEGDFKDF